MKVDPKDSCGGSSIKALDALLACMNIEQTRMTEGAIEIPIPSAISKVLSAWESGRQKIKDIKDKVL